MSAKVITITNHKGGVGKTTAVISVATILAKAGYNVLTIDAESQNNLTTGLLSYMAAENQERYFFDGITDYIYGHVIKLPIVGIRRNLSLVPSCRYMAGVENTLEKMGNEAIEVFSRLIRTYRNRYDYILIDCPPTAGLVTLNTYFACDYLFAIAKLEDDSFDGILNIMQDLKEYVNPRRFDHPLDITGIFINEYDMLPLIHRSIQKNFRETFGDLMLSTYIRKNTALKIAKRSHQGIIEYDPSCNAAKDYIALTHEILDRINKRQPK